MRVPNEELIASRVADGQVTRQVSADNQAVVVAVISSGDGAAEQSLDGCLDLIGRIGAGLITAGHGARSSGLATDVTIDIAAQIHAAVEVGAAIVDTVTEYRR